MGWHIGAQIENVPRIALSPGNGLYKGHVFLLLLRCRNQREPETKCSRKTVSKHFKSCGFKSWGICSFWFHLLMTARWLSSNRKQFTEMFHHTSPISLSLYNHNFLKILKREGIWSPINYFIAASYAIEVVFCKFWPSLTQISKWILHQYIYIIK